MTAPDSRLDSSKADRPGRFGQLFAILFLVAFTYLVRLPYLEVPLERDEGEYAYIAWRMEHGEIPYRDVFNQKAPGTFVVYWLTFAVLGKSARAIHLAGGAFVALEVILLYMLACRFVKRPIAIGAAMLCAWLIAGPTLQGCTSNTETFGVPFIVLAVLLSVRARQRDCWWEFLLAGMSVGIGSLMKQPILFFGAVPLALSLWPGETSNEKRFSILRPLSVGMGIVLVWLPVLVFYVAHSSLTEMIYWVWTHNLQYAGNTTPARTAMRLKQQFVRLYFSYWFLFVLAVVGLVTRIRRRANVTLLFVVWVAASILAVGGGHIYRHYFLMAVPVVLILAAVGFQYLWDLLGRLGSGRMIVRTGLILLALTFPVVDNVPDAVLATRDIHALSHKIYHVHIFSVSPMVGSWVKQMTRPDETIYVFGTEPQILFYAQRRHCTNHILTDPLFGPYERSQEFQEQVKQDILRHRPPVVVEVKLGSSVLMRTTEAPLFKFIRPFLGAEYVEVAGVELLAPGAPRVLLGRKQLSQWEKKIFEHIRKMEKQNVPRKEIENFIYSQVPKLIVHLRKDLLDRLPNGW